jgi:hypothetical protein
MKSTAAAEMAGEKLWRTVALNFRLGATAENGGQISRFSSANPAG